MASVFRKDLLEGKVAFVTGGGSGICKGITRAFLEHGAEAAIFARKEERLKAAASELSEATGQACLAVAGDVRKPETIEAALDATLERFGRIDIVVNGAAGNFLAPAAGLSYNAFATVMGIDSLGTFNVSKAAFDKRLRDHGGHLLNISATLHYSATPLQTHASAAKAAVDSLTRSLALEWGGLGIRVNGIAPGPIDDTEGMTRLAPKEMKDKLTSLIPMKRFGRVEEIADAALFLVSDAAAYIHGQTLIVDGGAWLPGGMSMSFGYSG